MPSMRARTSGGTGPARQSRRAGAAVVVGGLLVVGRALLVGALEAGGEEGCGCAAVSLFAHPRHDRPSRTPTAGAALNTERSR